MRPIRIAFCITAAACLLAGVGCGKKEVAAPTTKETKPNDTGTPTLPTAAGVNTDEAKATAMKAAAEFLKAVQEGKATTASLTVAFKKVIAPPELEADKALGYSKSSVQGWFSAGKATAVSDGLKVDFATSDYALVSTAAKPGRTYLRLVKVNAVLLIDYAIFGTIAADYPLPAGDVAARHFVAIAFAAALIGKKFDAVDALLSTSEKGKLAPPLFEADKEQGYSRSKLQSAFADLFASKLQLTGLGGSGLPGNMNLQLYVSESKTYFINLKLIPGTTPGEFLIDDYQQK